MGQAERLKHRRAQTAARIRKQELQAMGVRHLRGIMGQVGLISKGKKNELIDRLLKHEASTEWSAKIANIGPKTKGPTLIKRLVFKSLPLAVVIDRVRRLRGTSREVASKRCSVEADGNIKRRRHDSERVSTFGR